MKLRQLVSEYLAFKRSMGMRMETDAGHLGIFCKAIGNVNVKKIKPIAVRAYLDGNGPLTSYWHAKYKAIKGLYRYAIGRGYTDSSPLPSSVPKIPDTFEAYRFSADEFRRMLKSIDKLDRPNALFTGTSMQALLILLFNTGLRISEALCLTLKDFDYKNHLLTIRDSKFNKSRLVPISSKLSRFLWNYILQNRRTSLDQDGDGVIFARRDGLPFTRRTADRRFRSICEASGVRRNDGAKYQPRIHDIRHTFAINRLLDWYKKGADVQRFLPYLSTYLGHINISATQRYLTMMPDLLQEAGLRFERYAVSRRVHG